jgi:hypothetical protein
LRWSMATLCVVLLGLSLIGRAASAPLDEALQNHLLALFDAYNQAIRTGKVDEALKIRTAATRNELQKEVKSAKQRKEFLSFSRTMIPDNIEIRYTGLSEDGSRAMILAIATNTVPEDLKVPGGPPSGSKLRSELTLEFLKEANVWKFDSQTFGLDPDKVTACADDRYETIEAYDQDHPVSMGGLISRVAFKADHTLVVVRVLDEETCAFLPDRGSLEALGFDPMALTAYATVEIEGLAHRTNAQKIWVESLSVRPGPP